MLLSQLLQELEVLSYHNRVRRMIELGQRSTSENEVSALLSQMERGDFYERWMALYSCFGSRNSEHVLRALQDPSQTIRKLAIQLVPQACDKAQMRGALTSIHASWHVPLLYYLRKYHHQDVIDTFITSDIPSTDDQFRKLLPFASHNIVERYAAGAFERANEVEWQRLARYHPDVVLSLLRTRAEAATTHDQQVVFLVNSLLPFLVRVQADASVELVELLLKHVPLAQLKLEPLIEKRPDAMVGLFLRIGESIQDSFQGYEQRIGFENLSSLIERTGLVNEEDWFHKLPPQQRANLYEKYHRAWRSDDGLLSIAIVEALPRELREQEARRHLALPALVTNHKSRLEYAAYLSWNEAYAKISPFLRDRDSEMRIAAMNALITATRYHRVHLPEVLEVLNAHRNEPDMVRATFFSALTDLPQSVWQNERLEQLEPIIQAHFDATDTSSKSHYNLARLAISISAYAPEWSAGLLLRSAQKYNTRLTSPDETRMTKHVARHILQAFLPLLQLWETKKHTDSLSNFAGAFDKYLKTFDELATILERALHNMDSETDAEVILYQLVKYQPDRAAKLIPELLQEDPSWIILPTVHFYLHRHRQDLLTPFLGKVSLQGRFTTGHPSYPDPGPQNRWYSRRHASYPSLSFVSGFARWTPQQQATFADALMDAITNTDTSRQIIAPAIKQLAALPAIPPTHLLTLAKSDDNYISELTLKVLNKVEGGLGIPTLIEALEGKHATKALEALRRYLLQAPALEALTILRNIPRTRVTIAKEVIRLLGEMKTEEAYQELLTLNGQELHRDVRAALHHSLWHYLDHEETWRILEQGAQSSDKVLALSTLSTSSYSTKTRQSSYQASLWSYRHSARIIDFYAIWVRAGISRLSTHLLTVDQQRRLTHLQMLLLTHPEQEVRYSALQSCTRIVATDTDQRMLRHLLESLNSPLPEVFQAASYAAFATSVQNDTPLIAEAIRALLPERRKLEGVIQMLVGGFRTNGRELLPTIRAVLDILATDPLTARWQVILAIATLSSDEIATRLINMAQSGTLHAGALNVACEALSEITDRPDAIEMSTLETRLADQDDERLRYIALQALLVQGKNNGWNEERITRLHRYQDDRSPLVAETAQFVFVAADDEEDEGNEYDDEE